jgi:hypothetical protein
MTEPEPNEAPQPAQLAPMTARVIAFQTGPGQFEMKLHLAWPGAETMVQLPFPGAGDWAERLAAEIRRHETATLARARGLVIPGNGSGDPSAITTQLQRFREGPPRQAG